MTLQQTTQEIVEQLKQYASEAGRQGMARFGVDTTHALGGPNTPTLRKMAKAIGTDHKLAHTLWSTGVHEARMLATMVADPKAVTKSEMEGWAKDLYSWDLCDGCCSLWAHSPHAWIKAKQWCNREPTFVRRASYSLMAILAVHDAQATNDEFMQLLPYIESGASDERNFVKKAVNWALRQIGKRNHALHKAAIACAKRIAKQGTASARWVASDALRELQSEKTQASIARRMAALEKKRKRLRS